MKIHGESYHTIWLKDDDQDVVQVIDQRKLPFIFETADLKTPDDAWRAIKDMTVRGAPLIGVTAAYGMYLALIRHNDGNLADDIRKQAAFLKSARPTAVNLAWAVDQMEQLIMRELENPALPELALQEARRIKMQEISFSESIGEHGSKIIEEIYRNKQDTVNILTHCNAGWLACIDWGTATAPIYKAHLKGIPVHVWVDETRPRNQGARLTAFELGEEGVNHTVIPDNTGGHLMQHGLVDLVIVGSDRTTATGDVANKIGTYLKALAAFDNKIPFYAALPSSTIDWSMKDGVAEIPIEERDAAEVAEIEGWTSSGIQAVRIIPEKSRAANYGFDVTPARLVTGLITERGICRASRESLMQMFPESNNDR